MMEEIAAKIARKAGEQLDSLLSEGITRALGHSEWKIEELRGRLQCVKIAGHPEETFLIDGIPFLELQPFQHGFDSESGAFKCNWTRQYRWLFHDKTPAGATDD